MPRVEIAHTADLAPATLAAARDFLAGVFEGDFTEHDWEHALGGMHAVAWDGDTIVGHASLIQRRLLHGGRALRCGYVEGVGVRADRRRQGVGGLVMEPLERIIGAAYELGALGGTDEAAAFYGARGWEVWRGPLSTLTPDGVRPTPEEAGAIHVLRASAALDLDGELTCDWRDGEVW